MKKNAVHYNSIPERIAAVEKFLEITHGRGKKRITTLKQLNSLALNRKAVIWRGGEGWRRTPAAFMIGMPGQTLLKFFEHGLYEYKKKGDHGSDISKRT